MGRARSCELALALRPQHTCQSLGVRRIQRVVDLLQHNVIYSAGNTRRCKKTHLIYIRPDLMQTE